MKIIQDESGVTIVELLIVIVVLGLISAFAVVNIGTVLENVKQKGDEAVLNNINEATRLMTYTYYSEDEVFDGYDTDENKLNYLVSEGFLSEYPDTNIETNSYVFNDDIQMWTLNGESGSVTYTETDSAYFSISGSKITSYDTSGGLSIVIPTSIDGTDVTEIGQDSLRDLGLTSVVLQNGITRISGNAFHSNSLTTVTIPSSVTRIWHNAFNNNDLTSVTFNSGLERIEAGAFSNNSITAVVLPSTVTYVGNGAFGYGGNHIISITIGANVSVDNGVSFGTYGADFKLLYDVNKEAGTYSYSDGIWTKE